MTLPASERGRLVSLDCMRGVAALLVCAQHLRGATLVDFAQVESRDAWHSAFYFLTNLGHESVMVFFVLSGFFVGGSVLRAGARFDWADYLRARALRLWCVLVPCLVLTWLCDQWLMSRAPAVLSGAFAEAWHSAPQAGAYDASWLTALGNLFFMQTIFVPVYGSNGPLWSLANEAVYYVLFPLLWVALREGPRRTRLLHGVLAGCLIAVAPNEMRLLFAVWMLGVAVHVLHSRRVSLPRGALAACAIAFCAAIVVSRLRLVPQAWGPLTDYLVGLSCAAFCVALVRGERTLREVAWLRRGVSWLSDISFSLYLSHFPLVLVIAASRQQAERLQPDGAGVIAFAGWLFLLLAAGHAMWWAFERRTPALRAWIAGLPSRRASVNE